MWLLRHVGSLNESTRWAVAGGFLAKTKGGPYKPGSGLKETHP